MSFGTPSRARERVVLALGLASALTLVVAAFLPFSDPESAGRAQLARMASRAAEGLLSEWALVRRSPGAFGPRIGEGENAKFSWSDAEAAHPAEVSPPVRASLDDPHAAVYEALFAESERAELQQNDKREALALADEALDKTSDPVRRGVAHLRAIQIASGLGLDAQVRDHWERA